MNAESPADGFGAADARSREVGRDATVSDAVRYALAASLTRLLGLEDGVRSRDDPEDIHQARVATRRLRSALRTFGDVLEPSWTRPLREELRWLGELLGAVRDADVLRERLRSRASLIPPGDRPVADRLSERLKARRDDARARLFEAIRTPRYGKLIDALVAAANAPDVVPGVASAPADVALRPPIEALWKDLVAAIGRVVAEATDESLHAARIRSKRVRYAAEAVAPVFGKRARRFATAATGLQDVLGEHQDAVVSAAWLRQAAEAVPSAAFVAGELAAIEASAARSARAAWPQAWRTVSSKKLRFWT